MGGIWQPRVFEDGETITGADLNTLFDGAVTALADPLSRDQLAKDAAIPRELLANRTSEVVDCFSVNAGDNPPLFKFTNDSRSLRKLPVDMRFVSVYARSDEVVSLVFFRMNTLGGSRVNLVTLNLIANVAQTAAVGLNLAAGTWVGLRSNSVPVNSVHGFTMIALWRVLHAGRQV